MMPRAVGAGRQILSDRFVIKFRRESLEKVVLIVDRHTTSPPRVPCAYKCPTMDETDFFLSMGAYLPILVRQSCKLCQ